MRHFRKTIMLKSQYGVGLMKMGVVIILIIQMTACVTSRKVYTSESQRGHSINCSGSGLDWGKCYEKAGELCREKGYEIIETSGDTGGMTGNQPRSSAYLVTNRSMIIECKR